MWRLKIEKEGRKEGTNDEGRKEGFHNSDLSRKLMKSSQILSQILSFETLLLPSIFKALKKIVFELGE